MMTEEGDQKTTSTTNNLLANLEQHLQPQSQFNSPNTVHPIYTPAPALANSRYNRQILIPQISLSGQERISSSKILIIGLGGLGSPASLYLAGAGVAKLGLLDHDIVETSNLHRQIVHRESSVSLTKVQSALRGCRELNSDVEYIAHEVRLTGRNALDIIAQYDVVLDCTDNPATRYLISDCCVVLGKTLVSGAAQKLEGQVVVLNWPVYEFSSTSDREGIVTGRGPCYRCVFPHPPSPDLIKSCSEIGILGPVVGAIGTLMSSEALRVVVREGKEERKPTMFLYNAWPTDPRSMFRIIGLRGRRKDCVVCGDQEVLREKGLARITEDGIREGSMDYESWCGKAESIELLKEEERVSASEFLDQFTKGSREMSLVVDVREEHEVELGPKIGGSINIPLSRILRSNSSKVNGATGVKLTHDLDVLMESAKTQSIYFVCQQGNDSQIAAKKLMDTMSQRLNGDMTVSSSSRWIGDIKGGFIALDKLMQSS